jgi:hypothetical protein
MNPYILIALLVKHFIADFPLQTPYMLGKSKRNGWAVPLLAHSAVHGAFTLAILLVAAPSLWSLALVEVVAHFGIDRLKAHPDLGGRWNPSQPQFWWALGADQLAHNLCYVAIAALA